jgi:hypothetical protein
VVASIWYIEWEVGGDPDLGECWILARREWPGRGAAVFTCDAATIERIRRAPGLRVVRLPRDGEAFVDRSGRAVVIEAGGMAWRQL